MNIFENIPKKIDEEIFEKIISNKSVNIQRIISKGHTSPQSGWYNQEDNEWVIVLKGRAIISFESKKDVTLKEGDYLCIEAGTKHKVSWTTPDEETIWLAVHY